MRLANSLRMHYGGGLAGHDCYCLHFGHVEMEFCVMCVLCTYNYATYSNSPNRDDSNDVKINDIGHLKEPGQNRRGHLSTIVYVLDVLCRNMMVK